MIKKHILILGAFIGFILLGYSMSPAFTLSSGDAVTYLYERGYSNINIENEYSPGGIHEVTGMHISFTADSPHKNNVHVSGDIINVFGNKMIVNQK